MQFGINSHGVAHYANVLCYPKSVVGVPAVVVGQRALLCKNVPEGIRCITQCENAIALNHVLASADGCIADVEATPDKCGIITPERDMLAHANNFLTHFLQKDDMVDQTFFPDSILRTYRMRQLLDDSYGELDERKMMALLADHRGYPDCICRHVDPEDPEGEKCRTLLSIISVPEDGKIWVSPQPCEHEYQMFSL